MATVITMVNYDCTVIAVINYSPKTFIAQATAKNSFENVKKFFFLKFIGCEQWPLLQTFYDRNYSSLYHKTIIFYYPSYG